MAHFLDETLPSSELRSGSFSSGKTADFAVGGGGIWNFQAWERACMMCFSSLRMVAIVFFGLELSG